VIYNPRFEFLNEGNFNAFFTRVVPDVNWTLMRTHPLAGEYHNLTIFATDALERLGHTLNSSTSTLKLVQVVGGGESEWSVQELHGLGVCKNGKYHLSGTY
jgi:ketosteroid isomerase-like protein